jgi:type VI secretion system ImpA family protein
MATPPRITISDLLLPVPVEQPRDPKLERVSVYAAFREALGSKDAAQQDRVQGEGGGVELDRLIELGSSYLAKKSKDLVVAAWMVEILSRRYGFAGLRDGLMLMCGLIADFWDVCHPQIDSDGDTEPRARSLESVASGRSILLVLRRLPLADTSTGAAHFCYLDARKATAPTQEDFSNGPIGEAVSLSSRQFYEQLAADLKEAALATEALGKAVKLRFPGEAPGMKPLGDTIKAIQELSSVILEVKRRQDPDGEPPASSTGLAESIDSVPARSTSLPPGPRNAILDYGRVVIEFAERARALADDAEELKKNREAYEKHKNDMKTLDEEFEKIIERISSGKDFEAILARNLGLAGGQAPAEE